MNKFIIICIENSSSKNKRNDSALINYAAIQVLSECDRQLDGLFYNPVTKKPLTTISKSFKSLLA